MNRLLVNDLHSQLNATVVARLLEPVGLAALVATVREAREAGAQISICGGRHAMGGQQFGSDTWLLDLRKHCTIRAFDQERGFLTVDSGIEWPAIIAGCRSLQCAGAPAWSIRQKQTGADRLTIGGALSANIHGRGLRQPPIVNDVEAFTLIDAEGSVRRCSRAENAELFSLAIGGYGLFGVIADVTLRLAPRLVVRREVEILTLPELIRVPEERDTGEWLYGDFQFSIDERSPDFLHRGVFCAYRRVEGGAMPPDPPRALSEQDWARLIELAHTDRARVFQEYSGHYRSTHGQRYWSDTHQLGVYLDHYHVALDRRLGSRHAATEMITEIYVPRAALAAFMGQAADFLRDGRIPVIYGTVRLVERDAETVLAWAREPWACIIFNLCVEHTPAGLDIAREAFRGLIERAIGFGGSYYLPYHRWATRRQVEACHPRFREFLAAKRRHDPADRFTSDWYRHHRALFDGPP